MYTSNSSRQQGHNRHKVDDFTGKWTKSCLRTCAYSYHHRRRKRHANCAPHLSYGQTTCLQRPRTCRYYRSLRHSRLRLQLDYCHRWKMQPNSSFYTPHSGAHSTSRQSQCWCEQSRLFSPSYYLLPRLALIRRQRKRRRATNVLHCFLRAKSTPHRSTYRCTRLRHCTRPRLPRSCCHPMSTRRLTRACGHPCHRAPGQPQSTSARTEPMPPLAVRPTSALRWSWSTLARINASLKL